MTQPKHKKLIVYSEDIPLCQYIASTGISKALAGTFDKLTDIADLFIFCQTHIYHNPINCSLKPKNSLHILHTPWIAFAAYRCISKMPIACAKIFAMLQALIIKLGYLSKSSRKPDILLSVIGADLMTIIRAHYMAKELGAKHVIYLVDCIEAHPSYGNKSNTKEILRQILKQAYHVYCITDGLADYVKREYNCSTSCLPLVIPPMSKRVGEQIRVSESSLVEIVYLGSVNHLYQDGIECLVNIVETSNLRNLVLHMISPESSVNIVLPRESRPSWVRSYRLTDEELGALLSRAAFAYMPYTHKIDHKLMVSTSFPSKLLTYLCYARNILFYSPYYSTVSQFAASNSLPNSFNTAESMAICLKRYAYDSFSDNQDFSAQYQKALEKTFSGIDFRRKIESIIK